MLIVMKEEGTRNQRKAVKPVRLHLAQAGMREPVSDEYSS